MKLDQAIKDLVSSLRAYSKEYARLCDSFNQEAFLKEGPQGSVLRVSNLTRKARLYMAAADCIESFVTIEDIRDYIREGQSQINRIDGELKELEQKFQAWKGNFVKYTAGADVPWDGSLPVSLVELDRAQLKRLRKKLLERIISRLHRILWRQGLTP